MPEKSPQVYRIETKRLVVRCYEPDDAPKVVDSIAASLDHLRAWLDWAQEEPVGIDAKLQMIVKWRAQFARGENFAYGLFNRDETMLIGALGAHPRIGAGAREIGYWIRADFARQGLMTEAVAALMRVCFEIDRIKRIEIHCDPNNVASAGVPSKLGFSSRPVIVNCIRGPASARRDHLIWVMQARDFVKSPAAQVEVQTCDALKRPVAISTHEPRH